MKRLFVRKHQLFAHQIVINVYDNVQTEGRIINPLDALQSKPIAVCHHFKTQIIYCQAYCFSKGAERKGYLIRAPF